MQKLLIIGHSSETDVGSHLRFAAEGLGIQTAFCNSASAYEGPLLLRKFNWHVRNRWPTRLEQFNKFVLALCRAEQPDIVLATGIAPLRAQTLREIGRRGIIRMNYLTDDPWNPAHRAAWFLETLPRYDFIFSPRRSNLDDLRLAGCRHADYLPFGYAPEVHFAERGPNGAASDLVFIGAADRDRVPLIAAIIKAGFRVALYGNYWKRFLRTARYSRGQADAATLRRAVSAANVALCLVRRANRDGNAMRTFELPAIGACMLVESTAEHHEIFGEDGDAVVFFRNESELLERLRWLLVHEDQRRRLARTAHERIVSSHHTYRDRLKFMLNTTHRYFPG
jgi:spore maturation protein CgeB